MRELRIMIVGLGKLGSQVLDLFVRVPGKHHFLVGARDKESIQHRANLSLFAATQLGYTPEVACIQIDLWNVEQTAETIAQFQPDIIFCAASLEHWSVIPTLPHLLSERLATAPRGPLLPLHLTLVYKLMQAVRQARSTGIVLNAIYPDVVNPVLSKGNLAPTTGIGDLANNIPAIKTSLSDKLGVPREQVDVRLVMSRYLSYQMSRVGNVGGAPFHLTVLVNGEDLTHILDKETVFDLLPTRYKRPGGAIGRMMTAASAMVVFETMVRDIETITHVPGPNGLPGGYPVRVSSQGVAVTLPDGLTLQEAIRLNEEGLGFDGIEQIDEQGTTYFTERAMAVFREVLGYECKSMPLAATEERAKELQAKYAALVKKYK